MAQQVSLKNFVTGRLWRRICKRIGIKWTTIPHFLGSGSYASVFSVGPNMVIKFTKDVDDANAFKAVKDSGQKETIAETFDVFKYKAKYSTIYCIVMQELIELTEFEAFIFDLWKGWSTDPLTEEAVDLFQNEILSLVIQDSSAPKQQTIGKILEFLRQLARDTAGLGIQLKDIHGNNIMKDSRTKQYKVVDMGESRVATNQEIDEVLASFQGFF